MARLDLKSNYATKIIELVQTGAYIHKEDSGNPRRHKSWPKHIFCEYTHSYSTVHIKINKDEKKTKSK